MAGPRCRHLIRWYDNIPVLSWLVLRARCRDCGGPISARYPAVEALVAAVFVALAFAEPITMGANLPEPMAAVFGRRSPWPCRHSACKRCFRCGACMPIIALWCTLVSAALIGYDGKRSPWGLFLPALLVGIVARSCCSNCVPFRSWDRCTRLPGWPRPATPRPGWRWVRRSDC